MTDTLVPIANSTRFNPHETSTATPAVDDFAANFWGEDGFTFDDILDIINPLQHLPIISTLYREMTGDDISPGARVAGGGLFGGMAGIFVAVFNMVLEETTGGDLGEHVVALFDGEPVAAPAGEPAPVVTARRKPGTGQDDWMIAEAAGTTRQAAWRQTASLANQSPRTGSGDRAATGIAAWRGEAPPSEREIAATATKETALAALAASEPAGDEAPGAAPWLAAIPQAKGDYTAVTAEYMAPATADLLLKAIGHAADGDARMREAVERYERGATLENARDITVDNLL